MRGGNTPNKSNPYQTLPPTHEAWIGCEFTGKLRSDSQSVALDGSDRLGRVWVVSLQPSQHLAIHLHGCMICGWVLHVARPVFSIVLKWALVELF